MKNFFISVLALVLILTTASCSSIKKIYKFKTKDIKVALVLPGPINDSSLNKAAYKGLKRFEQDYKTDIAVVEDVSLNDAKKVLSGLADRNFDLIIALGYEYGKYLRNIANVYPKSFFCIIGGEISREPNLCSFNFKDEQYGYIIGVVAGLNTSTNKIGIVVGKKIPSIERSIIGMRNGLRAVNPKADLIVSYINTFNDINKGREAAIDQINSGVDIITHLADASGIGVIKAAEETDISAIGAVVDQHELAPSTIITSGIQDASQLIYLACEYYTEKILESKIYRFGLKHQVIDLTPSYGNIDPTTETRINRIKSQLTDQEITQEEETTKRRR